MKGLIRWLPRSGGSWGIVGGAILVALVAVAICTGPVRRGFGRLDEAVMQNEERVARNLRILAPASKEAVLRQYADFGERLKKRGSTAEENAAMLSEIEKIASGLGIALSATKPREPKVDQDHERYEVDVEFDADMAAVIRFMHAVESSAQLLKVERFALDSRKAGAAGTLRAGLLVSKVMTL